MKGLPAEVASQPKIDGTEIYFSVNLSKKIIFEPCLAQIHHPFALWYLMKFLQ